MEEGQEDLVLNHSDLELERTMWVYLLMPAMMLTETRGISMLEWRKDYLIPKMTTMTSTEVQIDLLKVIFIIIL